MHISVFSHLCIDRNNILGNEYVSWGSPGMYIGFVYKNFLNVPCTVFGTYGEDFAEYTQNLDIYPYEPRFEGSMHNFNIQNGKDEESVQGSKSRDNAEPIEIDSYVSSIVSKSDAIIISPLLPNFSYDYLKEIFSHADKDCVKVLVAQGYFRGFDTNDVQFPIDFQDAERIISLFDFVLVSNHEHPKIYNIVRNKGWRSKTNTIITEGKNGARLITAEGEKLISTKRVKKVVDTTGAGDIFAAGFTFSIVKTKDIERSIEFANELAAKFVGLTPKEIQKGRSELVPNLNQSDSYA